MSNKYKSLVNWYYIEDWSDYPGPKGRVVPYAEGYDNPKDYEGTELYIPQGTVGDKEGNLFITDEGNDVPFKMQYFTKINSINETKMNKETLRMQMLAGIITEGQYKAKLNENRDYIIYDDGDEPYIDASEFIYGGLEDILSQAGYDIPEDFMELLDEEAEDGDSVSINDEFPLSYYENFDLEDAKKFVNDMLTSFHGLGMMTDYDSVEDFKA
jgi:hypothetical protein